MARFNSQREIVTQLIRTYLKSCKLYDDLDKLGITNEALGFLGEQCANSAMDIIGFPVDDSSKGDESTFCRDFLFDAAPRHIESDTLNSEIEKYVDFLFSKFEKTKQETPDLFE